MQIVTLTTDFGTKDYYVAMLKGNILKHSNSVHIVDISHEISTHDIVEGAFFIKTSYKNFPEKTIHVAAVQSFNAENNNFLAFEHDSYFFIGPDNGFFSLVFDEIHNIKKYHINIQEDDSAFLQQVIAFGVAHISEGKPLDEIGSEALQIQEKLGLRPVITKYQIRATITHVDHFGNVIVNLTKQVFEKERQGRDFKIYYKSTEPIHEISDNYGEVEIGDVLCMFNSADFMEISINMGNAHEMLSLRKNETIQIDFID